MVGSGGLQTAVVFVVAEVDDLGHLDLTRLHCFEPRITRISRMKKEPFWFHICVIRVIRGSFRFGNLDLFRASTFGFRLPRQPARESFRSSPGGEGGKLERFPRDLVLGASSNLR